MNCISTINGKTKVYGIIGQPVGHSFSPIIHNTLARLLHHNLVYAPFPVLSDNLEQALQGAHGLHIQGFNITVPYKEAIIPYLYDIHPTAKKIGAVNTIKRTNQGYIGYNTDVDGLQICLHQNHICLENEVVVILGAGGAARAAGMMVAEQGATEIYMVNRTKDHAIHLAEDIYHSTNKTVIPLSLQELDQVPMGNICIQTTSVGMSPKIEDTLIWDRSFYAKMKVGVDIIYNPWKTKFLHLAEQAGCTILNGFDMLYYQAVKSYEIWNEMLISSEIKKEAKDILENYYIFSRK